jgi:DNA-binding NarL/FixJ family response regulator
MCFHPIGYSSNWAQRYLYPNLNSCPFFGLIQLPACMQFCIFEADAFPDVRQSIPICFLNKYAKIYNHPNIYKYIDRERRYQYNSCHNIFLLFLELVMKILLADDHALFREGISHALRRLDEDIDIVEAGNFPEALSAAHDNPDIRLALLDLNMPGSHGPASVELLHNRYPDISIVVISGSEEPNDIKKVMKSGAMGFVPKHSSSKTMLVAIRMVLEGEIYLPSQLIDWAPPTSKDRGTCHEQAIKHGLTERQIEVLQQVANGLSNKGIALALNLTDGTVKVHIATIFQTLGVNNRVEAIKAGKRLGLISDI